MEHANTENQEKIYLCWLSIITSVSAILVIIVLMLDQNELLILQLLISGG